MKLYRIFITLFLLISFFGCEKPRPPIKTLSAADTYFVKICAEELKITPSVIHAGDTTWIYVPMQNSLMDLKPTHGNDTPQAQAKESWSIQYLEALYNNNYIEVRYDIAKTKKYDKSVSFENKLSENFSKIQRNVLNAVTRAYFEVEPLGISAVLQVGNNNVITKMADTTPPPLINKDNTVPRFFVMVFIDIQSGVGMKTISYFQDMKMALSNPPALTSDEYGKRYVYDVFGDENLIGDKTGAHLEIYDIKLGDFLAKQIENRINNKFVRSAFPPTGEARDNIINIIAETCRLYNFNDFEKVKITDLNAGQEYLYNKNQL